jgi:hypothetical protein
MAVEIIVPLGLFATIFGVVYLFLTTRNSERLALIEKGADAKMFNTGRSFGSGQMVLSLALISMGIGVGVLTGAMLEQMGMDDDVSYPASIFIFAGLGLLVSYFVNRRLSLKDEQHV